MKSDLVLKYKKYKFEMPGDYIGGTPAENFDFEAGGICPLVIVKQKHPSLFWVRRGKYFLGFFGEYMQGAYQSARLKYRLVGVE